jgi:hypothetical protein
VVVVEAHRAVVEVLQVSPRFSGEGHDVVGELGVQGLVFQAAQAGDVKAGDRHVSGVAKAGNGA